MSIFSQLKEKVTRYVDVYVKLFKLDFIGRTSNLLSYFIFLLIGLFIVFCILIFAGMGLTEVFISLGLSKIAAYFITVGIYILLLIITYALRNKIIRLFTGSFIRVMTEGDEGDKEDQE